MSLKKENICRLCLKLITNGFAEGDELIRQMLDILLLKLDLSITSESIICQDCVEIAKKCLTFKLTCLGTERNTLLYSAGIENAQDSIKIIYKEREYIETTVDEDLDMCGICMTQLKRNNFACLDTLRNEMTMFKILTKYMLEIDLNYIENPMICTTCRENFKVYLKFVMNCLYVESSTKSFCKNMKNDSMDQVYLGYLQHFLLKDNLERPAKCPQICAIKEELTMFEDTKCVHPGCDELIKLEEFDIKEEKIDLEENLCEILPEMDFDEYMFPPNRRDKEAKHTISLKAREDNSNHEDTLEVNENENTCMKINNGAVCTDENKEKRNINRDLVTDLDVSETDTYEYTRCASEEKQQSVLRNDIGIVISHGKEIIYKTYKCSLCAYETKHKKYLKYHMLIHKDVPETEMYKCSLCGFKTKRKGSLRIHMLVHKDFSEIKMYKCSLCTYEAKQKYNVTRHNMLVHKDISEITMHKCLLCTYEAKLKSSLKNHMLVLHNDESEIKMHKCSLCDYEAKQKRVLQSHMLVHKDVSEIKMHSCSLCAYESKRKAGLNRHMLVHKDYFHII